MNKQQLAISVKKDEDISQWYTEVITKADLMDYSKVSGCIVYKPRSYEIWENIQKFLNDKIKKSGVKNCYFPLLIPESLLLKEEDHVEGFAPEVAWVDYGGDTKLGERLAVRPTSESIMYDSYSKWIQSYRDLPLRLNQWNSVVRWEFKHPTPFMRGREFLWQEGHTVYATQQEAIDEAHEIQGYYNDVYEELLAIPTTLGRKSIGEKFAGADFSLTVEPFNSADGKVIQGCTSHHLGQNFSKAFDITYLDKQQKKQYVWQNSWGLSTRTLGAMVFIHGDDRGIIQPPRVAVEKVVIIPLLFKGKEEVVLNKAYELQQKLESLGGVLVDSRSEYSPGFKFNDWELKGVPIRVEIGPRDIENNSCIIVRRDTNEKIEMKLDKINKDSISDILEEIHFTLYAKQKELQDSKTIEVNSYEEFKKYITQGYRCLVPWKETIESEDKIKEETGAKTSCLPFSHKDKDMNGVKCFFSKEDATCYAYFSKSH
ncbi:MAG: proline--tRNA ligase [Nanoarchaeota archaeon]|nr:proline--tRNA ligase [Nanoarchaeota archaeon]